MNEGIFCFSAFFLGLSLGLLNSNLPNVPNVPKPSQPQPQSKTKRRKKKKKAIKHEEIIIEEETKHVPANFKEDIEAIIKTYEDDVTIVSKNQDFKFRIFLCPKIQNHQYIYCSLYLSISLPKRFPQVPPVFEIQDTVGMLHSDVIKLRNDLNKKVMEFTNMQRPLIFEVCLWLKEQLLVLNPTPPPSPHVTMTRQFTEESAYDESYELSNQVKQELEDRNKRKDEPILLNSINNIKNLDKELLETSYRVPQGITGFDYKSYFDQIELIGKGGGGSVYKVMNKIDECLYAVKIINLKGVKGSNQIMKEVLVLSRLQHKNIVRYHNAWFEENSDDEEEGSGDEDESSFDSEESSENSEWVFAFQRSRGSIEPFFEKDTQSKGCKLYIQMEYCAGNTLQEVLNNGLPSHEDAWKMLKEILNALVYVHSRKTIHRDLKPSNIFLGGDGEVKLGDFGLAATSENKEKQDYAVGTPLYFSPEQEQGKYDQKSDMFALGIIFFEMWRSFGSYMQKATEIKTLGKKHLLPEDFEAPNEVKDIIIWLTHPEPEQRPTAEQVLLSSYLPHQIDKKTFEEFLRVATRPNTVENEWLYQEVFKQENQAHIEFTYNTTSAINEVPTISRRKIKVDSMIKTAVSLKLQEVFTNAGAVDIKTPLLYPYFKHFAISVQDRTGKFTQVMVENDPNASILIERSGIIVQLPDNSVVPWARKIAKKELGGIIKRFNMQIVYKTSGNREHPKEIKQARLDYCYETVYYNKNLKFWLQAEMLAITMQAIKEVLGETTEVQGGMIEVHVNDSRVIDAMMDYLEIRMNLRAKVLKVFANMYRLKSPIIKKKLAELGLSFSIVEKLEYYFKMSGKLTKVKGYLEKQPIFRDKVLQQVMNEDLSLLEKYCDYFGVNVVFNLSVVNEDLLYYSGFLCRIVYKDYVVNTKSSKKETIVLAAGGCYDNLINHYSIYSKSRSKNKNKTQNSSTSGLGITIYYENIISILLQSGNYSWLHGSTVFLTSKVQFDDGELYNISRKKIEHTVELWKSGISVIYNYNDMPTEDIIDMCRRYKIRICVFYEEKAKREQERVESDKKESEKTGPDRKDSEGDGKADMKITIRDFSSKQKIIEEVKKEDFVKRIKDRSALPVNKLNYPLKHNEKKDVM